MTTIADLRSSRTGFGDVADLLDTIQIGASYWCGTTTGSGGAYVASLTDAPSSYTTGMLISFVANHTNTTTATINVSGLGVKNIYDKYGSVLIGGELRAGLFIAIYDGTQFRLINDVSYTGTWTATLTNTTNIDSSSFALGRYHRFNKTVKCWGYFTVDPTTANSRMTLTMTIPIASNLSSTGDLVGYFGNGVIDDWMGMIANQSGKAQLDIVGNRNSNTGTYFEFIYIIN